jgi:hypothetical protein
MEFNTVNKTLSDSETQELITNVEVAVKSTLKKSTQIDDLASRLGMIHFRLSLLPQCEDTQALLNRTVTLAEKYYEEAVELRVLCQDLKEHLKGLKKENKQKTSGGSATARIGE